MYYIYPERAEVGRRAVNGVALNACVGVGEFGDGGSAAVVSAGRGGRRDENGASQRYGIERGCGSLLSPRGTRLSERRHEDGEFGGRVWRTAALTRNAT